MNGSDARREDDLDRREAEVMGFFAALKVSIVADVGLRGVVSSRRQERTSEKNENRS